MIKVFHKYRRSVLAGLVVCMVCLVMTGFGLDMIRGFNSSDRYAIKVGDDLVSFNDFYQQKRAIQDSYRRNFGEMYSQFAETLMQRLNDELVERIISDTLLQKFAWNAEMRVGPGAVRKFISTELFRDNFNKDQYRGFLQQTGMSGPAFEKRVEMEMLRDQMSGIAGDLTFASQLEAERLFERDETSYDISYIELEPARFVSAAKEPSEEQLKQRYEERVADLELPARARYQYVTFEPNTFLSSVEVHPEDVEQYYVDNQDSYTTPEQIRARHIQFTYAPGADPAKMAELKQKAEAILTEAQAGKPFEELAKQHSDDFATSLNGGDLGWLARGVKGKAFDSAAFKLAAGEVSGLISTDYGFHIVKVEERREAAPRKLDEVRAEIETAIRRRDAPAYATAKANDLFDIWSKSALSFEDFATQYKLSVLSSSELLPADRDPSPTLGGLTREVIKRAGEDKLLVELPANTVLVNLLEYKEPEPPALAEVRSRLVDELKQEQAAALAKESAERLLREVNEKKHADLKSASNAEKLDLKQTKGFKFAQRPAGPLSNDRVRDAILASSMQWISSPEVFSDGKVFWIVMLDRVSKPEPAAFAAKREQYLTRATSELTGALMTSLVNKLKVGSEIDVDPSILSQS